MALARADGDEAVMVLDDAVDGGEAEAARQAVEDAVKAAMLKADPTIGPVIEKVEAAIKEKREEREERHEGAPLP